MVDIGKTAPTPEILNRPGDILTHCFQGRGDGLLANGSVMPEAAAPRESASTPSECRTLVSVHAATARLSAALLRAASLSPR